MSVSDAWMRGYGRQADADLRAYELYSRYPLALASECHKLLFLQMACEKACKAYLIRGGADLMTLQGSHAKIAGPLPGILRQHMTQSGWNPRKLEGLIQKFRHIAREIELLNPAVDDGGNRDENCEYPWAAGKSIISPLDHRFEVSQLVFQPAGITFRKMLRQVINFIIEPGLP